MVVLDPPQHLEQLVLERAVEVDSERHLDLLVLAPQCQEGLVLTLAVGVDPDRQPEGLVWALAAEVNPECHLELLFLALQR